MTNINKNMQNNNKLMKNDKYSKLDHPKSVKMSTELSRSKAIIIFLISDTK